MKVDNINENDVMRILSAVNDQFQAALWQSNSNPPFEARKVTIDLTTARLETDPFKIGFPFTSFYVVSASDTSSYVKMRVDTADTYQDYFNVYKKDSLRFPFPKKNAYLFWPAQSNKTIEILFFVTGEFRPGSNVTEISSSVGANSRAIISPVTAATTETALLSLDLNRKLATIFNNGPETAYVGPTGVTTTSGIPLDPGAYLKDSNTSALYAISVGGTAVLRVQTES